MKIPFKVSARAGKLLGRENFSNPEGAIIELVKNSYDADANGCVIIFDIPSITVLNDKNDEIVIPDKKNSTIYIIDNGEGMTQEVIHNHWMKIGTGNKELNFVSSNKRVKTGAKGIGRFALDRLGLKTEMWTVAKSELEKGFVWRMDWSQFDESEKSISEIVAELTPIDNLNLNSILRELINQNGINSIINKLDIQSGTILKISNLKDEWYEGKYGNVSDVFKSLEALVPPKELNIPFDVYFIYSQKQDEYGKVETAYFNDYDYKLKAFYDSQNLKMNIKIFRNELDIKKVKSKYPTVFDNSKPPFDMSTLESKLHEYHQPIEKLLNWKLNTQNTKILKDVGDFNFTFYYLKMSNSKKEGYPFKLINPTERRTVLERFGGVKIYRDSFRVRPYGDPDNDWLKLGARRAKSPAGAGQRIGDWRVTPDSSAGIISISRKTNLLLLDKADRGAIQENEAFDVFKKIIIELIHEFEYDRSKILNPFYLYNRNKKEEQKEREIQNRAEKLAQEIVANRKKVEEQTYGAAKPINIFQQKQEEEEKKSYEETFRETFKAIEEEQEQKAREEIVMVRALASLGLTMSSFAHELKSIKNKSTEIRSLEKIFYQLVPREIKETKADLYNDCIDIFELLNQNTDRIIHWIDYSLTTIKKDKRKRGKFEFSSFFDTLHKTWDKVFEEKGISLIANVDTQDIDYEFRAFEMDMITVFSNLINNSIDSFERQKEIIERKIWIEAKVYDSNIEIIYSDNGAGLDEIFSEIDDIFLPFKTSKKDRKGKDIGTGLGMYLVKEVITDYAGEIEILDVKDGFAQKIILPTRRIKKNAKI
jgi:signal transduction histidine kinase